MQIHVNRVPEKGLRERATYEPAELDLERDDVRLPQPFAVEALVSLAKSELVVRAHIETPLAMTCARCLEEFPTTQTNDAVFTYTVQPTDIVDITDDVRQEILLGYPMVPLCRPDCKGLCIRCGRNLNHGSCEHQGSEG